MARVGYLEETVVASGARTASGNSGVLAGYGEASTLRVQLDSAGGTGTTPTLDVVIEDSLDGTNWNTIGTAFTQVTAGASRQVKDINTPFADRIRVRWTVGGTTPSFTFSVIVASQTAAFA